MSKAGTGSVVILKEHVAAHAALDRAAHSWNLETFQAAHERARGADRAYRADLISRGFPAPYGVGDR